MVEDGVGLVLMTIDQWPVICSGLSRGPVPACSPASVAVLRVRLRLPSTAPDPGCRTTIPTGAGVIQEYTGVESLPDPRRWTVHGRRPVYDSPWMALELVDVEPVAGMRYEHHVVVIPYEAVCVVVQHPDRGVLLLYRHRFITDTAGFELPAGGVEAGESVTDAAVREVLEETGWEISPPTVFLTANASDGVSTQRFHFAHAAALAQVGEPRDAHEADRLYWVRPGDLPGLIRDGRVPGCPAMTGLLAALSFGCLAAD